LTAEKGFKGKDHLQSRPYLETIGSEAKSLEKQQLNVTTTRNFQWPYELKAYTDLG
jgi:hypothetical protein